MKIFKKYLLLVLLTFGLVGNVQAITISGASAIFDDPNDLLWISGTVTSTTMGSFNEFAFDWDGALDSFDFTGGSVINSNLTGATFSFPAGGTTLGTFGVNGLNDAPFNAPLYFEFLFQLPVITGLLSESIDIGIGDDVTPGFNGGEVVNDIVRPVSGNLNPVPEPTTMLLFGIGLIAVAGVGRKK